MRVLHVTPHLGGGVGKAHAAMAAVRTPGVEQTFALLEEPRDRRYVTEIDAAGRHVAKVSDPGELAQMAASADIVQFEFWNHPKLFECLARCNWPAIRSVFWSHVSGLGRPVIQPGLIGASGRFVFTSEASLAIPCLFEQGGEALRSIDVIGSGFGFASATLRPANGRSPRIAYLGTVDFVKMHPGFFDAIDALEGEDIRIDIWGAADPDGEVMARARAMRHPGHVRFRGHTDDPAAALSEASIFFYPLEPDHYGTAENALVEAMSLGLVPVVMNNPAERAIVRHGQTGFVARSAAECADLLQTLLVSPELRREVGGNAARYVAETRTPERAVQAFAVLWRELLSEPKRAPDFRSIVGDSPAEWFLATQCLPGETWRPSARPHRRSSKGALAHFDRVFPNDPSLSRLMAAEAIMAGAA